MNATIWLKRPVSLLEFFPENFSLNSVTYGILIDVDNNEETGREGIDYDILTQWPGFGWGFLFAENSPTNAAATVIEDPEYPDNTESFVRLPLDLDRLSFPRDFKLMFYAIGTYESNDGRTQGRIIDFTSWFNVPPQEYIFRTSPNPVTARQGETTDITAQLRSTTASIPEVVDFNIPQNYSDIELVFISNGENKTYGTEPVAFTINVPKTSQVGNYVIPLLANISTGATFPATFSSVEVASLLPSQAYSTVRTNLSVNVMPPLSALEIFKEIWTDFGDVISLISGGFAAGFSAVVVDRLKGRLKSAQDNKKELLSIDKEENL